MSKTKSSLSIVIPVYNEQNTLSACLDKVLAQKQAVNLKEIIIVDDASTDGSEKIASQYKQKYSIIKYHRNQRNRGKGYSVKKGIIHTKSDIIIIQDADLEYNPADYPLLLQPFIENEAQVVFGSRFISHRPHRVLYYYHSVGNRLLTTLSNLLSNLNLTDMECGYKAFNGDWIRTIAPSLSANQFGFEPEIVARTARDNLIIYEVGVSYSGRTYAEGKKITWKDGLRAIWEILYFNILR